MPNPNPDPPAAVTVAEFARELVETIESWSVARLASAAAAVGADETRHHYIKSQAFCLVVNEIRALAARHGVKLEEGP